MKINKSTHNISKTILITSCVSLGIISIVSLAFYILKNSQITHASTNFIPGNIISDSKMSDFNSMSESDIRAFIQQKNTYCSNSNSMCFKNYKENGRDAAGIIYDASREQRINPQVILVTIQKEQGLLTNANPQQWMYNSAMGYNCPDSTPGRCGTDERGFLRQVIWGSTMYRAILDGGKNWGNRYGSGTRWITPYVVGSNQIQWSTSASCGSSTVNIENRATQALYNYTPYRPNSASLNAGYGEGDGCSTYGNRNFFLYMRDWFGYVSSTSAYSWSSLSQTLYTDTALTAKLPYEPTIQPGQTIYGEIKVRNTGGVTWTRSNTLFATEKNKDRTSVFKSTEWINSTRAARLVENQVAPGEVGTFLISLTAPNSTGSYKEYFNIVLEGQAWLNDIGFYFPIKVAKTRDVQIFKNQERTIPIIGGKVNAGDTIYVRTKLTNNTLSAWPANTRIATTSPDDRKSQLRDNSWISGDRVAQLKQQLNPGQSADVDFTIRNFNTVQNVKESFGLVIDGVRWIERDSIIMQFEIREKPLDTVVPNESLVIGADISSNTDKHKLILQDDGNLVLYSSSKAIWSTNSVGSKANKLILQDDGNLVLYSSSGAVWSTNTAGRSADRLILQDDSNLVLYAPSRPLWSTNTAGR